MHCRLKDLIWWIPLFLNGTCCNQYWLQYVKSTNQVDMPSTNLGSNADTFKTCYQFLKDFYLLYKEIWNSDFHFEKILPVFTFNMFKELKNIGISIIVKSFGQSGIVLLENHIIQKLTWRFNGPKSTRAIVFRHLWMAREKKKAKIYHFSINEPRLFFFLTLRWS